MLTRRQSKPSRIFVENRPDKLRDTERSETIENIVKTTSTNNDDELVKRVTMITEERLSDLVPVIADLISLVSNKVQRNDTLQIVIFYNKSYCCSNSIVL